MTPSENFILDTLKKIKKRYAAVCETVRGYKKRNSQRTTFLYIKNLVTDAKTPIQESRKYLKKPNKIYDMKSRNRKYKKIQ